MRQVLRLRCKGFYAFAGYMIMNQKFLFFFAIKTLACVAGVKRGKGRGRGRGNFLARGLAP